MQSFSLGPYKVDIQRRAFQRSMTLRVPNLGRLKITCGMTVPMRMIVKFIEEKMDFVKACEVELERQRSLRPVRDYITGEKCPFLGVERFLIVHRHTSSRSKVQVDKSQLLVSVSSEDSETVKHALDSFYKKSGANYLTHLVKVRAQQMGLHPTRLSFRAQRTRWGSCTSRGAISLNWRLVAAPHEVMDYVVVHELAHLKFQDHSRNFWGLVEEFCPDYRKHKKWLKVNHFMLDFLG